MGKKEEVRKVKKQTQKYARVKKKSANFKTLIHTKGFSKQKGVCLGFLLVWVFLLLHLRLYLWWIFLLFVFLSFFKGKYLTNRSLELFTAHWRQGGWNVFLSYSIKATQLWQSTDSRFPQRHLCIMKGIWASFFQVFFQDGTTLSN